MISRVVKLYLLSSIRVGSSDLMITHLKYEYDTITLDDAIIDNIWTIKAILRGFELASGLFMNFSKSSLTGVNSDHNFLDLACEFLHCRKEYLSFKYLELPIRVDCLCQVGGCL